MIDWQAKVALDRHRERLAKAERNYEVYEALHMERGERDIYSRFLKFTGLLLVDLGKRLQRWAGTQPTRPNRI